MANYQDIKGFNIQSKSSDPVPYAQELVNNPWGGAWASGTNVNTARRSMAGSGTVTASIIAGGLLPPGSYDETEVWNGTAWTEKNDLNTGRYYLKGSGTSTAFIAYGGMESDPTASAKTEKFDGTNWTEVGDLNTARQKIGNSTLGTITASIAFGGSASDPSGGALSALNESWNGTGWTEVGDLNTARKGLGGAGTSTAALAIGGNTGSVSALNEKWNGTAWTEVGDINTAREQGGSAGSQTSAVIWSGYPDSPGVLTEQWDGSSWTEVADLANKQIASGSAGVSGESAAAISGTNGTANVATVEEWTFSGLPPSTPVAGYSDSVVGDMYYNSSTGQFKAIKQGVGSWATGGDLNNGRGQIGSASISGNTTGFGFGGWDGPASAVRSYAEQYDGTSWTEGPDMPGTARLAGAFGVNTSCISAGGSTGPSGAPIAPGAFEWNGSSWSNGGSMNNARRNSTGAGISESAGRVFGGGDNPGPAQAYNESYNGTAFTEETDLNTARIGLMGFGTTTDAVGAGGDTLVVEQWNGSSWTEISEILQKTDNSGGRCGSSSSDGMIFTRDQSSSMITQKWDGTSWTELADLSVSRYNNSGGGPSSSNALSFGGYGPPSPQMVSTEEWEVPDFAIKTVTTS